MVDPTMDAVEAFRKQLDDAGIDVLRELVKVFAERLMAEEADEICGAPYGERSEDRVNRRNGYRARAVDTRVGTIALDIPKLREGSYFPGWLLEPRRRAERALVAVVAECYVKGVSTRRVDGLVKTLGIEGMFEELHVTTYRLKHLSRLIAGPGVPVRVGLPSAAFSHQPIPDTRAALAASSTAGSRHPGRLP